MFTKSSVLFLSTAITAAFAARIPIVHNYGTVTAAEHVHHAKGQQFLITDITKPHVLAGFQANFFRNACGDDFIGQVTGSGGATCVQSIPGTKAIALLSQPSGCTGKASRLAPNRIQQQQANMILVTVYTDENCSNGATLLNVGQCLQETETGVPSYSIDGNC
ncbi:MAG: hypothetical protein M1840_008366 [Geoglossum simile]|nr:MAG: hypothetical protein M1840_008366 [Geoglossum simile]